MTGSNMDILTPQQLPGVLDRYIKGARVMQNIIAHALREAKAGEHVSSVEQTLDGAYWCIGAIWEDEATLMKWIEDQRRKPAAAEPSP